MNRDLRDIQGVVELTRREAQGIVGGPTAVEYAVMLALRTSANQGSQLVSSAEYFG